MSKSEKNHDTGLRILEVLKILLEQDVTKNELIEKLKCNSSVDGVYTQEVFLKYFNTFEKLGLKLKKDKTRYGLVNALLKIDLTEEEKISLCRLINTVFKLNNKKSEEILRKMFLRLDKYVDIDIKSVVDKTIEAEKSLTNQNIKNNVLFTLKNMLYDNQKVSITYKKGNNTQETIIVELKEIIEKKNDIYVLCYNNSMGRNKRINIESIISLEQLPGKVIGINNPNTVVFQVYGRLSAVYKLRNNEKLLDFGVNHQTISNVGDDNDTLLLRLLKYGENCKIIKPLSLRTEFLNLTNEILKNLESTSCQE